MDALSEAGVAVRLSVLVGVCEGVTVGVRVALELAEKALEQQAEYERWIIDRHGDSARAEIDHGKAVMKDWKAGDFADMKAEGESIEAALADALQDGLPPDSVAVTAIMRRHHAWISRTWKTPPTREAFIGLAAMYGERK
jgi:hypothetical protein